MKIKSIKVVEIMLFIFMNSLPVTNVIVFTEAVNTRAAFINMD